jgi:hypothetical protein
MWYGGSIVKRTQHVSNLRLNAMSQFTHDPKGSGLAI